MLLQKKVVTKNWLRFMPKAAVDHDCVICYMVDAKKRELDEIRVGFNALFVGYFFHLFGYTSDVFK